MPAIDDPGDQDVQGTRILTGFLTRAPFHDYCCRVADRTYTGKTLGPKLQKLRADHPRLYHASIAADYLVRLLVTLMLIGVAALILWKTLAPLPPLFSSHGPS